MLQTTRSFLTQSMIALSTLLALPAASQTLNESNKLTPFDSAAGDRFGRSIAIDNGVVAVGAYQNDSKSNGSGSVYLFDASSGAQLFELLQSDGAANDRFGRSIAMADGIVVVGASGHEDNGSRSGSAYLFDVSTGAQIAELLPNDGEASDSFGTSIAIDNGIIAVGAAGDDDNGDLSGSAYLFDASTGAQLFKLLPNDGAEMDYFGFSIAIDNGIVAVGASWDDDNGTDSGSVYLFDVSTGVQIAKLLPNDGEMEDYFGRSIAISNGVIAVGAPFDSNGNGDQSGSVYLFDASTGGQIDKLLATDGETSVLFGVSVAIDSGIVAAGVIFDNDNGFSSGSAYIFDVFTGNQIAKLLSSDGQSDDRFGNAIAIENGVIAAGAPFSFDAVSSLGSAYIFDSRPAIAESLKITASDGELNDLFGNSIAIDNATIAVGASNDNDNGDNSGSAYLFDAFTGGELVKLLASDGAANDLFGRSIAIDNAIVAVGASGDDDNGNNSGSAYLFDASNGGELVKLLPSDGAQGDQFGISIAIDSGVAAVGAWRDDDNGSNSGSVYLFDASGTQLFKLFPSDGSPNDSFGTSVAIDNGVVAVGNIFDDDNGIDSGSVYLFDAFTGTEITKLLPSDGAPGDQFGISIAINNGIVVVGAHRNDDNGTDSGSAYLFDASTGNQIAKLLPSAGSDLDLFGFSVAIDNGLVAVGEYHDSFQGTDSGSAYLFDASTGTYIDKLLPSDGAVGDQFGYSIAISNGIVAAGAWHDQDNGNNSGSIYVFDTAPAPTCPADLTADGQLDFFDISAFLTLFSSGDLAADFTNDAQLDFFDISAFLTAFSAGCP